MHEGKRMKKPDAECGFAEVPSSSRDPMTMKEAEPEKMSIDQVLAEVLEECERAREDWPNEYAWDDVNNIPLPIGEVKAAR